MINIDAVKKYCKDYKNIENYDKAINDTTQTWDCHHRLETDEGLSIDELILLDKYFNRPANELIFLTKHDHHSLSHPCKNYNKIKYITVELINTNIIFTYNSLHEATILIPYLYEDFNITRNDIIINIYKD